jgi:hypothetical protein
VGGIFIMTKRIDMQGNKLAQKHGLSHTRLHRIWHSMYCRCYYSSTNQYKNYGGKGIKVCEEWKHIDGFINFYNWAINNGYSEKLTLDRIDNEKDYCPENCRWVDRYVQNNNQKSNCLVTYKGETHSIGEWARILNMNRETLDTRLKCPTWSLDDAFTIPVGKYKGKQRRAEKNKLKEKENNGIHA